MGNEEDDIRWSLGAWGFGTRKRTYYRTGSSIALAIRSLDLTLGLLEAGAQGNPIAVIIHSFDRTLQTVLFKQALRCSTA